MKQQKINSWTAKRQLDRAPLQFLESFESSDLDALEFRLGKEQTILHRLVDRANGIPLSVLDHDQDSKSSFLFIEKAISSSDLLLPFVKLKNPIRLGHWLSTLQKYLGVELTAYIEQKNRGVKTLDRSLGDPIRWSMFYLSDQVDLRKTQRLSDRAIASLLEVLSPSLDQSLNRISPLNISVLKPQRYRVRRQYKEVNSERPSSRSVEDYFRQLEFCRHLVETMTWVLLCLDSDPPLLESLKGELHTAIQDEVYQVEHLQHLPQTLGVILETLRLAPPHWLTRWSETEELISSGMIADNLIDTLHTGAALVSSPYLHHRDPLHWPSSRLFEPRRFQAISFGAPLPPSYYPLGPGSRGRSLLIVIVHSCAAILNSILKRGRVTINAESDSALTLNNLAAESLVEHFVGVGFGSPQDLHAKIEFDERFVYIPSARV